MTGGFLIVPLLTLHLVAFAVWVGSLVALAVVTRTVRRVFDPRDQARFFPALGRSYAAVGPTALVTALLSGAILAGSPGGWATVVWGALGAGLALLVLSLLTMRQAHRVGKLRRAVAGGDTSATAALAANARTADLMRYAIASFTLIAVVLEASAIAQR